MSDYDEERYQLIARLNTISRGIKFNRGCIDTSLNEIETLNRDIEQQRNEIKEFEIELQNIVTQLNDNYKR